MVHQPVNQTKTTTPLGSRTVLCKLVAAMDCNLRWQVHHACMVCVLGTMENGAGIGRQCADVPWPLAKLLANSTFQFRLFSKTYQSAEKCAEPFGLGQSCQVLYSCHQLGGTRQRTALAATWTCWELVECRVLEDGSVQCAARKQ